MDQPVVSPCSTHDQPVFNWNYEFLEFFHTTNHLHRSNYWRPLKFLFGGGCPLTTWWWCVFFATSSMSRMLRQLLLLVAVVVCFCCCYAQESMSSSSSSHQHTLSQMSRGECSNHHHPNNSTVATAAAAAVARRNEQQNDDGMKGKKKASWSHGRHRITSPPSARQCRCCSGTDDILLILFPVLLWLSFTKWRLARNDSEYVAIHIKRNATKHSILIANVQRRP